MISFFTREDSLTCKINSESARILDAINLYCSEINYAAQRSFIAAILNQWAGPQIGTQQAAETVLVAAQWIITVK